MKVFCFFYGTGDSFSEIYDRWAKSSNSITPKNLVGLQKARYVANYRINTITREWNPAVDYLVLVEGETPHGMWGINSYATSWITNNIVQPIIHNRDKANLEDNKNNPAWLLALKKTHKDSIESLAKKGIHLLTKADGKWDSATELPDFLDQPVDLFLTGFSRGSLRIHTLFSLTEKSRSCEMP
jgi:hypothetical protein